MASQRSGLYRSLLGALLCLFLCGCPRSHWTEQAIGTDAAFRDIFFLDAKQGWMVGGGHGVDGGILGETRDGGETWTFRTGIVANPRSRLFHLNAIHFRDASRGVIASDGGRLLLTVDGGEHWHPVANAGRRISALFFLDSETGWAVGENSILHTNDGGGTWVQTNAGHQMPGVRGRGLHFVDADRGWLVGSAGTIQRTRDAGSTWERVSLPPGEGEVGLSAVYFIDEHHGWIVGERGLALQTRDGGQSWSVQDTGTTGNLSDVYFTDPEHGWIIGYQNRTGQSIVLHTDDGGRTWHLQARIEGEALEALFFQADGRGWAVGDRVRREPQRILRYAPPEP